MEVTKIVKVTNLNLNKEECQYLLTLASGTAALLDQGEKFQPGDNEDVTGLLDFIARVKKELTVDSNFTPYAWVKHTVEDVPELKVAEPTPALHTKRLGITEAYYPGMRSTQLVYGYYRGDGTGTGDGTSTISFSYNVKTLIEYIYYLFTVYEDIARVTCVLREEGVEDIGKWGGKPSTASVKHILGNKAYRGSDKYPSMIKEELFDKVQGILMSQLKTANELSLEQAQKSINKRMRRIEKIQGACQ